MSKKELKPLWEPTPGTLPNPEKKTVPGKPIENPSKPNKKPLNS